ncbi:unnamed protein product, partial [Heterosigma akashiwo]
MKDEQLTCSFNTECPSRYQCYGEEFYHEDKQGTCGCIRSLLLSGPDCKHVDGVVVLTGAMLIYILGKSLFFTFKIFRANVRETKRNNSLLGERRTYYSYSRKIKLMRMRTLSSLWLLLSSLFFFTLWLFTFFMVMGGRTGPTLKWQGVFVFNYSSGLLFRNLALLTTGAFWVEVASKQGHFSAGQPRSIWMRAKTYQLLCGVFAAVFVCPGIALWFLAYRRGAIPFYSLPLFLASSSVSTMLILAGGRLWV